MGCAYWTDPPLGGMLQRLVPHDFRTEDRDEAQEGADEEAADPAAPETTAGEFVRPVRGVVNPRTPRRWG